MPLRPSMRKVERAPARMNDPKAEPTRTSTRVKPRARPAGLVVGRIGCIVEIIIKTAFAVVSGIAPGERAAVVALPTDRECDLFHNVSMHIIYRAGHLETSADRGIAGVARIDGGCSCNQPAASSKVFVPALEAHFFKIALHDLAGGGNVAGFIECKKSLLHGCNGGGDGQGHDRSRHHHLDDGKARLAAVNRRQTENGRDGGGGRGKAQCLHAQEDSTRTALS